MEDNKGQILLYQTPDGESRIEVFFATVQTEEKRKAELDKDVVVAKFATTTRHGAIDGKLQDQTHLCSTYRQGEEGQEITSG